ncbi:MAG: hypothetical protein LBI42_14510 [Chitinispirillales bacterium]|jgi:Cu+-exporting ATPase|nr:hypothetical protein [Chitinispirillales bacterium]
MKNKTKTTTGSADEQRARKQKEIRALWIKFITAAALTTALLYVSIVPMIRSVYLPYPDMLNPIIYPIVHAAAQLILTLPVVFIGYKFYTVGFKALWQKSPNFDSLIATGTSAAVVYSVYNVCQIYEGNIEAVYALYFMPATVVIMLILFGKTLKSVSKGFKPGRIEGEVLNDSER